MKNLFILLLSVFLCVNLNAQNNNELPEISFYSKKYLKKRNYSIPVPFKPNFSNLQKRHRRSFKSLPAKFDAREKGWITSVKNQGKRGACWEFAAMAAIEANWKKNGYGTYDLSELNMGSCHGFEWGVNDGGNMYLVTAYLSRLKGPYLEEADPYDPNLFDPNSSQFNNHPPCKSISTTPPAFVPEVIWLPKDNDLIKETIMRYGAVATNMHQESDLSLYMSNTDYTFYYDGTEKPNHAILLVGWDDNKVVTGGTKSPKGTKGAWIVKNSFGAERLDKGYFYISYKDTKVLTEAYCFPKREEYNPTTNILMYDKLGMVEPYFGIQGKEAYGLIKFNVSGEKKLSRIGTFTANAGTFIDIEVYSEKNENTLTNLIASKKQIFCNYPGYHTFELPETTVKGDFYVKVKYYINKIKLPLLPIETEVKDFARPLIQKEVAWISSDGKIWEAVGKGIDKKEMNVCIRAYTHEKANAYFTANHNINCIDNSLVFTADNKNQTAEYKWDFGEGAEPPTANTAGPHTVKYSSTGIKNVVLSVIGNNSSDKRNKQIEITNQLPVSSFVWKPNLTDGHTTKIIAVADAEQISWSPATGLNKTEGKEVEATLNIPAGQNKKEYKYTITAKQGNCSGQKDITINVVLSPENDNICDAIELSMNKSFLGTNKNATVEQNEVHPDTTGVNSCEEEKKWCDEYGGESLHNSVWYYFVATESGTVSIDMEAVDKDTGKKTQNAKKILDTQIAVYEAESCTELTKENARLIAAYDDYYEDARAAIDRISVEAGKKYWVQIDGSGGGESGYFSVRLKKGALSNIDEKTKKITTIYPNPTDGKFTVILPEGETKGTIEILTLSGKKMWEYKGNISAKQEVDSKGIKQGMYIIKIKTKQNIYIKSLIIK